MAAQLAKLLCSGMLALAAVGSLGMRQVATSTTAGPSDDIVVTSDGWSTCFQVNVGSLDTLELVYAGDEIFTPGRLDVDWSSGLILAVQSHHLYVPFSDSDPPRGITDTPILYAMWPRNAERTSWRTGYYYSLRYGVATSGDAAILPGGDTFLLSTVRWRAPNDPRVVVLANERPFHVRKFAVPPYPIRRASLGEPLASFETDGVAAEIELTSDGAVAHIVTDQHVVHSIRTDTLVEVAPPIAIPPITGLSTPVLGTSIAYLRADLSPDDRYLIVNQGRTGKLTLVDLEARTARTLTTEPPLEITGGVAINGGWENRWRLAVHARNRVVVYDLDPTSTAPLQEISTGAVPPQDLWNPGVVYLALAWSGRGDKLIAESPGLGGLQVFAVEDDRMELLRSSLGCGLLKNDIWTRNGELVPSPTPPPTDTPTPTSTETPVPTDTPTPTSTPRASATATPSATPTATNTPSPTAEPRPIYMPLALHERCDPTQQRIDVALVIDASTSMNEPTRLGRPKIAAALEAARAFLDLLSLEGPSSDQAAIVAFNAQAQLLAPLTNDRAALEAALDAITLAQQTRLDLAVAAGAEALADGTRRRSTNQQVLVLLTDGRANPVPVEAAVEQAALAKAADITLFTIGLGEDLDAEGLAAMASTPSGFLRAPDAEDLAEAYGEVARSIPCPASAWWGGR